MTQTSLTNVLAEIDTLDAQATEHTQEAGQHRQAAQRARAEAEQFEQLASDTARIGGNEVLQKFNRIMRELSTEVDTARKAAIDAVHRGEQVLDTWVRYRLTAARARGRWTALSSLYQNITGHDAPSGPYRPELREESFGRFFRGLIAQAEADAFNQANQQAKSEIDAHRTARQQ